MLIEQIPDAIFFCAQFLIPLLFIVRLQKLHLSNLSFRALTTALNISLLIAALLTAAILLYEGCLAMYSNIDTDQFALLNRFTGTFSMFAWLGLVTQVILPQIMWSPNLRRSVASGTAWLVATLVFRVANMLLLQYVVNKEQTPWTAFIPDRTAQEYLTQMIIFLVVLTAVYLTVNKKKHAHHHHHHHHTDTTAELSE